MEEIDVWKYTFDDSVAFLQATRWNDNMENYPNGVNLKDIIYIENPDWTKNYENSQELKRLCIDIEVLSDGSPEFPTANKVPIYAIGCYLNDEYKQFLTMEDDDKELLQEFVDWFEKADPDSQKLFREIKN
jgi:DNA polymerase elongation subunit (family B)